MIGVDYMKDPLCSERVEETLEMLDTLLKQSKPSGTNCVIENVNADSFEFVIKQAMHQMKFLNDIRWDEIK